MGGHETRLWRLLPLLQQVLTKVGVHRTETGAELGLTNLQLGILGVISRNDNCMMSQVVRNGFVAAPTATRIVDELVRKSLVERAADDQDRRVVRLRITQRGRETVDRVHQEALLLLSRILAEMSWEEQEALLKGLDAFILAVVATEEDGDPEDGRT